MSSEKISSNLQRRRLPWKDAVAGATAGAFSRTLMAPLERVKLLMQLRGEEQRYPSRNDGDSKDSNLKKSVQQQPLEQSSKRSVAGSSARPNTNNNVVLSPWSTFVRVYREQGVRSFWRGNGPNVVRVAGSAAINFTSLDMYKKWLSQSSVFPQQQVGVSLVAGGLAGFTSTTLLYPVEFVRTRLAMDVGRSTAERYYQGPVDVGRHIFRADGVRGFYKGYGIAVTGGVFYRVLYLGGYDAIKEVVFVPNEASKSWTLRVLAAQSVSLVAGTLAYPLDSVRRRLMMQAGKPHKERLYHNAWHCIGSVYRAEGLQGFYRGIAPNLLRSVGGALLLVGYDYTRSLLE